MTCFDRFEFELTCQRKIIILNYYLFMGRKKIIAGGKLNWKTFHLFCFLIITWCSGRDLEKYKLIKHVGLFYVPCPGPWLLNTTRPCCFLCPACVSPLLAVLTNQCCCCKAKNPALQKLCNKTVQNSHDNTDSGHAQQGTCPSNMYWA